MQEDVTLSEIRKAYKNLTEGEAYNTLPAGQGIKPIKGYGDKKPTEVSREVGAAGGADVAGSTGTKAKTGEQVEVKNETEHGDKSATGDGVKPVARGEGVKDAQPEAKKADIGSKKAAGEDGGVKRGEGAEEASKGGAAKGTKVETGETKEGAEPYADFRSKVRNILGLAGNEKIVNGPLNEPNKGLNKGK
jgi:hypothetical protein